MALPTTYSLLTVSKVPEKAPDAKEHFAVIKDLKLPELGDDSILAQLQYASVDPYLRGQLYTFTNKKPIMNFCIGKVIAVGKNVDSNKFAKGSLIQGFFPMQTYFILPHGQCYPIPTKVPKYIEKSEDSKDSKEEKKQEMVDISIIPKAQFIGQFGMPGITAYYGLFEKANCKSTDNVLVSGGAGAVGSMVGQLAKVLGCKKIVGTAGSKEKCEYMKSIGFTHAINYKENNTQEKMQKALKDAFGEDGIDVYYDNTGGNVTNSMWDLLNFRARVAVCGQITQYNSGGDVEKVTPFLAKCIYKEITIKGLAYMNFKGQNEFYSRVGGWIANKQITLKSTVVKGGIDAIPQAFCDLFTGKNIGKLIVDLTES